MSAVVVIGGGVGGMAAALRLRAVGHEVILFERNNVLGGKLATREIDGYRFDIGPSLLTWPSVFSDLFASAGVRLEDEVDLVRLAEPFRYTFPDGSTFNTYNDSTSTRAAVAAFAGYRAADEWTRLMERGKRGWDVSERTFFAGAMESPRQLFGRMRSPVDFIAIDPLATLAHRAKRSFKDVRLRNWLNRYATYSGSDPWRSPATAACIPYLEQQYGAWHVNGGLASLATALERQLARSGVEVHVNRDVSSLNTEVGRVTSVTVNGAVVKADIVIANCDAEHLYSDLLPDVKRLKRVRKAGRSTSGYAMLLGLQGRTPGLAHHNVWFSRDQKQEFEQIRRTGVAEDPTIYVCASSVTDPTDAPDGCENWFVLVNTAAGAVTNWKAYGDRIIDTLGVSDRVMVRKDMNPSDYAAAYRAPAGAIYGSSSNGKRSAFLRSANRGPVKGLYLVGGSSHPGGGLPLVVKSAEIVSHLVQEDFE